MERAREAVKLLPEERQMLARVVNKLDLGVGIEEVRQQLPVPFEETVGTTKEPPGTLIGTSLWVFVVRHDPEFVSQDRDLWVRLWFDANGDLISIHSGVEEIESRSLIEGLYGEDGA